MDGSLDNLDVEIRHLRSKLDRLANIIDSSGGCDILIDRLSVPQDVPEQYRIDPLRLSLESIDLIKQQVRYQKSPTLTLLEHLSITGRRRLTVRSLLYHLELCNLKWAANYVRQTLLGVNIDTGMAIEQPPQAQNETGFQIEEQYNFKDIEEIVSKFEDRYNMFDFELIYESTCGFCHQLFDPTTKEGTRVGDGRFSTVFRATTHLEPDGRSQIIAAKLLKSESDRNYLTTEIELAMKLKHENILELYGLSIRHERGNRGYICLIYPYMQNGSLLRCLSDGLQCMSMRYLDSSERFKISIGIAAGIAYLQSYETGPIIHRDIKSANILIDIDLSPKIGDFTLLRQLQAHPNGDTQYSQNVIGTSVYMPPEAFQGKISPKFDVFSFGVVMFELLTGLKPFNEEDETDLLTFVFEKISDLDDIMDSDDANNELKKDTLISDLLDQRAGDWNFDHAKGMFNLALKAAAHRKKKRPEMEEILTNLKQYV